MFAPSLGHNLRFNCAEDYPHRKHLKPVKILPKIELTVFYYAVMTFPGVPNRVSKHKNTFERVVSGKANANIDFQDLCHLLTRLHFNERTKGSHHIFTKSEIPDIVNVQAKSDGKAKPYQVRQVATLIARFNLKIV